MDSNNISNITGDHNISLTGVEAGGDIIIKIADDLPPEVKQQKQELSLRIEELVGQLNALTQQAQKPDSDGVSADSQDKPAYGKIDWRRLSQAIKHQGCVLFIGPEMSVDEEGKSLHYKLYQQLSEKFKDIDYQAKEGFFTPGADKVILYDILDYYTDDFPTQNKTGRAVLEKLAQFPFNLTISLCPDDTIHRIYNDYDLNHQYIYFDDKIRKEVEMPDNDNPVIYNALGSASENGRYIFTHENLYNYLSDIRIPPVIKKKIKDATHFLFIGFDFNKWYNRLLLFVLDLEDEQSGFNVESHNIAQEFENFIEKQFNIVSVQDNYGDFISLLSQNARDVKGLLRDLGGSFIQTNFESLKKLSTKVSDEKMLEVLLKLNEDADSIEKKIESFKKLRNT